MIEMVADETKQEKKMVRETSLVVKKSNDFQITDQKSYDAGRAFITEISKQKAARLEWFDPLVDAAFKNHRALTTRRKESIDPLDEAMGNVEKKATAWRVAQKEKARKAEEERRQKLREQQEERMRKEREKKAKEEQLKREAFEREQEIQRKKKEAEEAEAAGHEDKAEELRQEAEELRQEAEELRQEAEELRQEAEDIVEPEPEPVPLAPTVEAPVRQKGEVHKKDYEIVVVDMDVLIKAVAAGRVPIQVLTVSKGDLKQYVRLMNGAAIPGVKVTVTDKTEFKKA